MAEFIVDTNVLSRIFTGDKDVKDFIETLDGNLKLVTYNVNDFHFIQSLKYLTPPV